MRNPIRGEVIKQAVHILSGPVMRQEAWRRGGAVTNFGVLGRGFHSSGAIGQKAASK